MSKRTYEEYIKNDCHPVGYNEPCQSYYFGQTSVDLLLDKIDQLKQQLKEKDEQIKKRVVVYEKQFIEQTDEIYSLKQQLAEKQNTIDEINREFVQAVHDWKALCAEKDKEFDERMESFEKRCQKYYNSNEYKIDFAIQELAEVERLLYESHYKEIDNKYYAEYEDINSLIDSRIKALEELKGEKK